MLKKYLLSLLIAFTTAVAMPVCAAEYKLFVVNPAGTGIDRVARKLSQVVKSQSGIDLIVINQTSGGGLVAVTDFKKERLALIFSNTSHLAYLPIQLDVVPYHIDDFNVIAPLGISGSVFFTREGGPIKTINDLEKVLPKLPNGAIGVSAADQAANAKALINFRNINVPVVNFKNVNDVVTNVVGGFVEVGVAGASTTIMWNQLELKQLRILGIVNQGPWIKDGQTYPSINQTFNIPPFYSGSWVSVTPGDSKEAQMLKKVILDGLKDPELQGLIKEAWPLGHIATIGSVINTANKYKELIK